LQDAVKQVMVLRYEAKTACDLAYSMGMRFQGIMCQQDNDKQKQGGGFASTSKYGGGGSSSSNKYGGGGKHNNQKRQERPFRQEEKQYREKKGFKDRKGFSKDNKRSFEDSAQNSKRSKLGEQKQFCRGCGVDGHKQSDCGKKDHRFYNQSSSDFDKSEAWRKVKSELPSIMDVLDYPRIPTYHHLSTLDGTKINSSTKASGASPNDDLNMVSQCCESCNNNIHACILSDNDESINMLIANKHQSYFNYTEILIPRLKQKEIEGRLVERVPAWALIDTGALHGSYVGTWIIRHNIDVIENKLSTQVCNPINNSCVPLTATVIVSVSIYDENKINKFDFEIELKILPSLDDKDYDIIIGLPDIKKHNLLEKLARQFSDRSVDADKRELQSVSVRTNPIGFSLSHKFANLPTHQGVASVGGGLESSQSSSAHTRTTINSARTIAEVSGNEDMLGATFETTESLSPRSLNHRQRYDEDDEVIQYDYWDDAWQKNDNRSLENKEDFIELITSKINSQDPMFKIEARAFLESYKDLFSRTLSATPAKLPPLEIEVDSKRFLTRTSQGPPRMMTAEKERHIEQFIKEGLESDIIRASNAAHYSQVHLVPKPTNTDASAGDRRAGNETCDVPIVEQPRKWRTTIDYRFFNQCITPQHWPLPNIAQMLQRIGRAKPKYFAKLDMTSGYWQAPLAESTKRFTAFITFMGIFEWNRAPMGTQPAGGYFHQCIAFIVLAGLIYTILESYIDDIIVHAKTKEEFWKNLHLVFLRFRAHRITFNPDKVFLSDSSMEFVGHEIDHDGIKFSNKKLSGVNLIPVPATKGDLKKFLGVANYFRDHVRNHSILAHPLSEMLPGYVRGHRNHKLVWSEGQKESFYALRDAVANCPKLHFINDFWEIGLETDASDYGIGAFLFQIDPASGNKIPVQFVSKSLTGPQLRWSTPEKEMYAKYFAVKKLEYILGDVPFTWYTDHKNNTLLRNTGSDKVLRWDLYLQQFDITKKYIKGEDNEITDTWSRLCAVSDKTEYLTILEEMECPDSSEYLNLMTEREVTVEELAILAQPRNLTKELYQKIAKVHNSTVGHLGVERVMAKLKRLEDTWEGMRADVILFLKQCPACQKMSRLKVPIHTTPFTAASYGLMKKLSMDCIGPLKETDDGYTHILVIIDNFTRYAMLYALRGVTALEVAQNVLVHIGTFGCPAILQMDNGTEFINETVAEVIKLLNTRSASILAYSKEENAIVERCNKEVMRHLRAMVFEINKRDAWKIYLPLAQRIINSEIHSRTGVSPNDLVFGGKIDLQGGFLTAPITQSTNVNIANWSSDMINLQNKLIDMAQKRQSQQDEAFMQKRQLNNNNITEFRHNSFVLVSYPDSAMGVRAPTKLHTHWKGPMRVISNKGAEYILRDLVQDKNITVHVSRLKKFEHDPIIHNPLAIAAKDYEEDEIESIISHTGDPRRKASMEFLVRWLGYDESEDLWLPWSELRLNTVLHAYLRANGMENIIPK